jgi:hypothetical protein
MQKKWSGASRRETKVHVNAMFERWIQKGRFEPCLNICLYPLKEMAVTQTVRPRNTNTSHEHSSSTVDDQGGFPECV